MSGVHHPHLWIGAIHGPLLQTDPDLLREMYCAASAEAVQVSLAEPAAEPSAPPKPHDDFTLADWRRAFANYDRKPWAKI